MHRLLISGVESLLFVTVDGEKIGISLKSTTRMSLSSAAGGSSQ